MMKFNWRGLIFWYLIFDLINDPLRDLLIHGKTDAFVIQDFQDFMVTISGHFSFFLFGAFAYTGLFLFYPKRQHLKWILIIILGFILPIFFRYLVQEILLEILFGFSNYSDRYTFPLYMKDNIYFAFRYVFFGVVYYFIQLSVFKEGKRNELEIENQRKELSILRSQINPHFLLNAMNNIYALIYHKSDKALGAMDSLSSILQYSLYEKRNFVSLSREMDLVSNLIELNKMRYDFPIKIKQSINPELLEVEIPPFIILPLIENAFKHGDMQHQPEAIKLFIEKEKEELSIVVENRKSANLSDEVSGIGLDNIRKRLELIYPHRHSYKVIESEGKFEVNIKLPLK